MILLLFATVTLRLLHAQTPTIAPADAGATAAKGAPTSQAPDEATRKIADLVHSGKYADAQKLVAGLLIAYPDDQRLIKAKALIEKLLAPGGSTSAAPTNSQPAQPAVNANTEQLTGMDEVEYNSLIELARQAQQTTDLDEQKKLLRQFMDQSGVFLQKNPYQMLLWQLRAASAIRLNDPMSGYEAGQKLLAAGAADSNDPNVQRLLAQLNNKGWLDKQEVGKLTKYDWISGTFSVHFSATDQKGHELSHGNDSEDLSKSGAVIESSAAAHGFRGTVLDSGEISWEHDWNGIWQPISCEIDNDKQTMKFVFSDNMPVGFRTKKMTFITTFIKQ